MGGLKNSEKFFFTTQSQDCRNTFLEWKEFSLINSADCNHFSCLSFADFSFSEQKGQEKGNKLISKRNRHLYRQDMVLVIKSKYPLYDFFHKILKFVVKKYKLGKTVEFKKAEDEGRTGEFFQNCDYKMLLKEMRLLEPLFEELFKQQLPYYEKMIFINWDMFQISFQMCGPFQSKFLELSHSLIDVVRLTSWKNFITIFFALLLEKSLVIFCERKELLSKFVSFFSNSFKPFLWCFPVIFFLQQTQFEYLDSPVPIIIGVGEKASSFL